MTEPDVTTLAALIVASDATYHTRNAPVLEQIFNYVWNYYGAFTPQDDTSAQVTDVNGLGVAIIAEFVAHGMTSAIGGVAYWLEQIGNKVLTYPYTRASNNVLDVPTS